MEAVGEHLAGEIGAGEHRGVGVDAAVDGLEVAGEAFVVGGFRGELELARAAERAVDALLGDDALDRLDARVEGAPERGRLLGSEGLAGVQEAVGEAVVEVPAVAARGAEAHRLGFEDHDAAPLHGKAPRRAEAGEARADHRDVVAARDLPRRGRGEGRGAVVPVGQEFHLRARRRPAGRRRP